MARNDNTAAELSSMIYAGAKPWHGCGVKVDAGLSWRDVPKLDPIGYSDRELRPMQTIGFNPDGKMVMLDVPTAKAVVRVADNRVLATVGNRYSMEGFQPIDTTERMFQIADGADSSIVTAGFLRDGNIQWAQAKVRGLEFRVPIGAKDKPASVLEENLTMFNSFDGTLPFTAGGAATDIVCCNTFMHALGEATQSGKRMFKIKHTRNGKVNLDAMVEDLKAMRNGFESFAHMATKLAETRMSKADFISFTESLIPDPVDASPTRARNKRDMLLDAWSNAPGQRLDGKRDTAWGALSAVTFFTTWQAPVKSQDENAARWYNATLGDGADLADTALQTLRVYAGA